jgi:NADH pyrophosphatase NudC (nudix superfamily)
MGDFCGKCGTKLRPVSVNNKTKWKCPKCHPEKIPDKKDYAHKTGKPCKDKGFCRPERCVIALECDEMIRINRRKKPVPKNRILLGR